MYKIRTINLLLLVFYLITACDFTIEQKSDSNKIIGSDKKAIALAFNGKITLDENNESIVAIEIKKQGTDEIIQTIEDIELPYQKGNPACEKPIFEDLNFDGIPDLRMPESIGTANIYYIYWLYNATTKKFERNTEMDLCLPTIDVEKKQIQSFSKGAAAEYTETTYGVENGKFVTLKTEGRAYLSQTTYHIVVHERQADGTMKKVRDATVEEKE